MKILVTGAGGQVGREIISLDLPQVECFGLTSSQLDITDANAVRAAIIETRPDAVINAAAYTAVDQAEEEAESAFAVNRDGVANLAHACKALDIPLLHISTDYVFDGSKTEPYTEDDEPGPINVYGASKLAGERALQEIGVKHLVVRVGWVFGRYGNNFVKTMLRLGAERKTLSVVDDQLGGPTGAASLASCLVRLAQQTPMEQGVLHLPSEPAVSWHGFAKQIFNAATDLDILDKQPTLTPVGSDAFPTKASRPRNSRLSSRSTAILATIGAPLDWRDDLQAMLRLDK